MKIVSNQMTVMLIIEFQLLDQNSGIFPNDSLVSPNDKPNS